MVLINFMEVISLFSIIFEFFFTNLPQLNDYTETGKKNYQNILAYFFICVFWIDLKNN